MQLSYTRDEWAKNLAEAAGGNHGNEAELRHTLYTVLAPYCLTVVGLEQSQLRHEGTSSSGRFDTMLGSTLIEYKTPGELDTLTKRRHHAEQALRYLGDERIGATVVILTDGRTWGILRDPSAPDSTTATLDADLFPESAEDKFQWRPNSEATAGRVLDLLDTLVFDPVTPSSLMTKLGPTSTQGRHVLSALTNALTGRSTEGRTDILFRQWLNLAGVSYGIGHDPDKWPLDREKMLGTLSGVIPSAGYAATIFTLHTYVALCSKLIAAEALALSKGTADHRPSQWATHSDSEFRTVLEHLESGQLAEEMNAPRMMGGDLFGWYADAIRLDLNLRGALRELTGAFAQLGWARLTHATRVSSDLLRDFYTGIVPRGLRKGLGEFFTPEWIAERVVDKAIDLSTKQHAIDMRFLDPTCGSGTFLVAAMRRAIVSGQEQSLSRQELARRAVASVTGFDVNPVSPLMARVNLLLTLGDLVDDLPEVGFNVFQADSILIPEEPTGQVRLDEAHAALTIPLVIGDVSLPRSLATLPAIAGLARIADMSIQRNRDEATFSARLRSEFPTMGVAEVDSQDALNAAVPLYAKLRQLHVEGRDGVWAHVIEQAFAPRVLDTVDVVVGNPPWISWKNLPAEWRARSESTWRKWGLWQSKTKGGGTPMGDISSLLLARAIATYCPSGVVALLLPEGVLINEPGGRAIRRCVLGRGTVAERSFNPIYVDDFSTLNPFTDAATRPIAVYVNSGQQPTFPIDGQRWTRTSARTALPVDMPLTTAAKLLETHAQPLHPVVSTDSASAWRPAMSLGQVDAAGPTKGLRYTWGQGFHTRGADGIFYCEVLSESPFPGGLVRIRTRPDLGRNTKDVASSEALIEAKYLWPLVRGANVQPFAVERSGLYCIVPHDPEALTKVLSRATALRDAPRLYDYFEPFFPRLEGRSAYDMKIDHDYPWGIQGTAWKHMSRSRILVVCRYMEPDGRPPAAVSMPLDDTRLGYRTTAYPNNKVNFVACESLAEADFIAAFVNSDPAQSTISRRSSTTTIAPGTLNALALPQFDPHNDLHRLLSAAGQECRVTSRAWPALSGELTQLVEKLIEEGRS